MLSKFISLSETRFQNTETALTNQQASIQGLETQIGQLSKLISKRPQGSLPSNTEPNPREHLNAISELTLRVGDETITLQACSFGITSNIEGNSPHQSTKTDNMTLQKLSFKEVHEPCSGNDRGHIHEERRLRIEELDEWRAHKLRTHDKLKLRQNEPDTSPNQLKVGDKVLLDAADPHIVTTTLNEEIPLTVLSIFPFGTVEVSHPKFGTFKLKVYFLVGNCIPFTSTTHQDALMILIAGTMSSSRGKKTVVPASKKRKGESSSAGPTVEIRHPLLQFPEGSPKHRPLGAVLRDYRPDITGAHNGTMLNVPSPDRNDKAYIRRSFERRMNYMLSVATYISLSRSAGRREITGVVNTHDVYFLWCMSQGHIIDLAYFIALAIQHQTERHRKGVISIGPYVTRLHEDPPTQPPPPSRPVHAAASYADISERLTRFEHQCFQRFENIDTTLQQICQHLHISSPVPPREPSSDEDV
ncbi:hypothetical protein GOBAR_AA12710 [Gossypium barbadense]|uniref:Uncharacterized protein n=1 Tax=Gossypium barbadense TaxID=3634 RepID=A0A2P5XX82_GOSBA|nr:hypothetical protein GOBAR_AA12710 [Gossypium barbadense]